MDGASATVRVDVLIIGGGTQGLWLLHDLLRPGYSAVLLDRGELGGGQTCHSHVYIHQGYLYSEVSLAARLKGVNTRWERWIRDHSPLHGAEPSFFGFRNRAEARHQEKLWRDPALKLSYIPVGVPPPLVGGEIKVVFVSPEQCLDGESLMRKLLANVVQFVSRISKVERFSLTYSGSTTVIKEVRVWTAKGPPLTFLPEAVVFTAGAGNQALLECLWGGSHPPAGRTSLAQQIRKGHMLVARGKKGDLDPLTGVFHLPADVVPYRYTLFIVSRDLGSETVWLISDNRSPATRSAEEWLECSPRSWLPLVLDSLQKLAPRFFGSSTLSGLADPRGNLRWGIYEAPKAEGMVLGAKAAGHIPHEERVERFDIANLWVIWPTKLTLAPKVSLAVASQIAKLLPVGHPWDPSPPPGWLDCYEAPGVASERWQKTPLIRWDEFCRCYL